MSAPASSSPADMLSQLEAARKLALGDSQVYSQVVPGVLPLIGTAAALEVRRWGADFLAECFASPSLPQAQKEQLVADVLPTLRGYLDNTSEDQAVLRSAVQAAASLYPLAFKRMYVEHFQKFLLHLRLLAFSMLPKML
jgi:symplekin